jgi:hypothetical protein
MTRKATSSAPQGAAATNFVEVSDARIRCRAAAQVTGPVTVTVQGASKSGSLTNGYAFA